MKKSATSRRMQALSGVGWSATLLGLLLMAVALLDASAALFSVAVFLVFAGRALETVMQGWSRPGMAFVLAPRAVLSCRFQRLSGDACALVAAGGSVPVLVI